MFQHTLNLTFQPVKVNKLAARLEFVLDHHDASHKYQNRVVETFDLCMLQGPGIELRYVADLIDIQLTHECFFCIIEMR